MTARPDCKRCRGTGTVPWRVNDGPVVEVPCSDCATQKPPPPPEHEHEPPKSRRG